MIPRLAVPHPSNGASLLTLVSSWLVFYDFIIVLLICFVLCIAVLSHVLHVTCARLCEAYLLSVVWLEKVIESQLESGWDDAASEVSSPVGDATSFSSPLTHPSRVLPLFFLPPQSEDSAGGSSSSSSNSSRGGHQESKASERGGPGAASAGAMSGLGVVHDAMLGHVALFRTSSGMTSAVNLTLHVKLCELQDSLQVCSCFLFLICLLS